MRGTMKAKVNVRENTSARRRCGSDVEVIMADEPASALWVERNVLPFGAATKDPHRRWYEVITGRMPICSYLVAVCYVTAVILLGWLPWNSLLILLLFSDSKLLRVSTLDDGHASDLVCRGGSCQ
jgi:hypothetical protein